MGGLLSIWQSTIGKKAVMAVTGLVFIGYCAGHMLGNLQIFSGRETLDAYAQFLHGTKWLLWGTRSILLVSVVLHVVCTVQLARRSRAARPVPYTTRRRVQATIPSLTMLVSGPILLAFVVFHLGHLTWGWKIIDRDFTELGCFDNLVRAFGQGAFVLAYLAAMAALGLHLRHGAWSLFQSLGINHPRINPVLRGFALVVTLVVVGGFSMVPLGVALGLVK